MASRSSHNKNNSAVKRILQEAKELGNDTSTDYCAAPLEEDIFEWHCTIRGPADTEFAGGLYHCRVLLPSEYPFKPPSIMLLTPNGRFELNKKICISFTAYHEDLWQPAWGIRTAIVGLQGFFPIKGEAAIGIGALKVSATETRRLAAASRDWVCPNCGIPNKDLLPEVREKHSHPKEDSHDSLVAQTNPQGAHVHATVKAGSPQVEPAPSNDETGDVTKTTPSVPVDLSAPVVLLAPSAGPSLQGASPSTTPAAISPPAPAPPTPVPTPAPSLLERPPTSRTTAVLRLEPLPSRPPLYLDGLIVALVAVMAYILAKKVGMQQAIFATL
ncbi:UBC-like protein [Dacryopinax primogenitus]|uniref:UBC-like protein n=1 Tax=Dacryopinax primogenitus (strain DJM 731) TaxID=1858805 RepID=M5GBK7_DACPD|nr:UBC-like protein [Dacryopinax primogenitus]EJU05790.1 UBC-like protein [Dacryopinax primogenitus]